jgi:hypothetical protein
MPNFIDVTLGYKLFWLIEFGAASRAHSMTMVKVSINRNMDVATPGVVSVSLLSGKMTH